MGIDRCDSGCRHYDIFYKIDPVFIFSAGKRDSAYGAVSGKSAAACGNWDAGGVLFKGSQFPFGVPELVSVLAVVVLHVWKRNNLLSIGVGTVLYMALVQTVFAAA